MTFGLFAQNQEQPFTVGYWVSIENDSYRQRAVNELENVLENSNEWLFDTKFQNWETDIHVIISAMQDSGSGIAWSITFTPIFTPRFTNGTVAVSHDTISGVNWAVRQAGRFVEEQMYLMLDSLQQDGEI